MWFIGVEVEQGTSAPLLKNILDPPLGPIQKLTKKKNSMEGYIHVYIMNDCSWGHLFKEHFALYPSGLGAAVGIIKVGQKKLFLLVSIYSLCCVQ